MSEPTSPMPIRGSCLCGGVRFEVTGKPLWMSRCHCARCRKSSGGTTVSVRARDFPIAADAFDDDPGVRLAAHTYVVEKPPWYEITDDLPRFPADPPGFGASETR